MCDAGDLSKRVFVFNSTHKCDANATEELKQQQKIDENQKRPLANAKSNFTLMVGWLDPSGDTNRFVLILNKHTHSLVSSVVTHLNVAQDGLRWGNSFSSSTCKWTRISNTWNREKSHPEFDGIVLAFGSTIKHLNWSINFSRVQPSTRWQRTRCIGCNRMFNEHCVVSLRCQMFGTYMRWARVYMRATEHLIRDYEWINKQING